MAPGKKFAGASVDNEEIKLHPELELDYITAVPRMALYMKCSTEIYNIYLKYVAPEDIHVYSIDEVFMDVTDYLNTYRMTARELAGKIIREIQQETSIAERPESERICTCVKLPWILWRSILSRIRMG